MAEKSFREFFEEAYQGIRVQKGALFYDLRAQESLATAVPVGHPDFQHLQFGQLAESSIVVFFLDIRGFTRLSIVLENEELVRILQAMTAASVKSVLLFGGYVGDFTGDGIMAYFGNQARTDEEAAFDSLRAASFLMKGIKEVVNPQLKKGGDEPLRIAMGMEHGRVLWARIGLQERSAVKPISEVAFLAGKLSAKPTEAWQCKVGPSLADWIPQRFKERAGVYSFEAEGASHTRELYSFKWDRFSDAYHLEPDALKRQLVGRKFGIMAPLTATSVVQADSSTGAGPRPLKDQPFF